MSELDHIIRTVPFEQLLALVVTLRLLVELDSVPSVSELRLGSVAKNLKPKEGRASA